MAGSALIYMRWRGAVSPTSDQIACSLFTLLVEPGLMAEVRADPALLASIVNETIRLEPGISIAARTLIEPVEVGGLERPAGAMVWLSTRTANTDPKVWRDVDVSDPGRFTAPDPPRLLTFGGGPHACLGSWLARLTLEETIRGVADLTPTLTIAPVDIQWMQVLGVNPDACRWRLIERIARGDLSGPGSETGCVRGAAAF